MDTIEEIQRYIHKRRPSGVIVDTNILLLLLVGNYKSSFIKDCILFTKNKKNYTSDDFVLLQRIIGFFANKLIVTPHILAELSNLSITGKKGMFGEEVLLYLQSVVNILKNAEEHHQHSEFLWGMKLAILSRFGFTDLTIYELAKNKNIPILTDELDLYLHLRESRFPVIKFQNIKNSLEGFTLVQ